MTGVLAGYISARFYKFFNGTSWLKCAMATALFIPSIFAFYFIVVDMVDWWERTLATPFSMMSLVLFSWVSLNFITIFIGSWLGFIRSKIEVPAKPSRIQRSESEAARKAPFYTSKLVSVPIGSFLCFACIGTEVYYLVTSVWRQSYYMMFIYLFLSLLLMAIVAVQVSII
jgi:transmembrane 9 superfamily protein 2/4